MPNYNYDPADYINDKAGGGSGSNLLPVGKHIVRVTDHELSETSTGLGQVIVTFEARDGRSRKAWLICEGRAGFQFGSLLNACGWTSKIDLTRPGMIRQAIYGKDLEIVVADDTYNGETKPKVKWINKPPTGSSSSRDTGRRDEVPPPADEDIPF